MIASAPLCHLLILGCPRSGTTLLASSISRHSDACVLNEDPFGGIKKILGKRICGNKLCVPNEIELSRRATYLVRFAKKLRLPGTHPGSRRSILDYLALENPRIIGILRNGHATIRSQILRGHQPLSRAVWRWQRTLEIFAALLEICPEKILFVSYERFVSDPENELRRCCAFLEAPFEKTMLEGYKYNRVYQTDRGIDASKAALEKDMEIPLDKLSPQGVSLYNLLITKTVKD